MIFRRRAQTRWNRRYVAVVIATLLSLVWVTGLWYFAGAHVRAYLESYQPLTRRSADSGQPVVAPTKHVTPAAAAAPPAAAAAAALPAAVASKMTDGVIDSKLTSLQEAIAFYEPVFKQYREYHNRITSDPEFRKSANPKFVVISPIAQLSNRMRILVSGLIYGMLTNRVLLMGTFAREFYCQFSDLFAPLIEVERMDVIPAGASSAEMKMTNWNDMFCGNHFDRAETVTHIRGYDYFMPELYLQPATRKAYHQKFGRWDGRLFKYAYQYFFPPTPSINAQVEKYMKDHFEGHYMVGLHIRSGGDFQKGMNEQDWLNYKLCADALVPPDQKDRVRYFAAIDTRPSRDRARAIWGDKISFFEDFLISNFVKGVQQALVDQILVSKCDLLIVTPASSYSETAATLSDFKPAYFVHIVHGLYWYNKASAEWQGQMCRKPKYMQLSQEPILKHRHEVSCKDSHDPIVLSELLD